MLNCICLCMKAVLVIQDHMFEQKGIKTQTFVRQSLKALCFNGPTFAIYILVLFMKKFWSLGKFEFIKKEKMNIWNIHTSI